MLDTLITSKTRIKLLLKFFLNANNTAHLRGLATELHESSNAIRLELNRLQEAGMIQAQAQGNKKIYQVNTTHPLYNEINSIVRKFLGLDVLIERVVLKLGNLSKVYLIGEMAKGLDAPIIDLLLIGDIDKIYLNSLIDKVESMLNRKLRILVLAKEEFIINESMFKPKLLLWEENNLN